MTKEEAWLVWMNAAKTTDNPIETDFDVIKRTSWWAAFSAGWDAAAVNLNGWDNAYMMGVQAGKELKKEWVGLTRRELDIATLGLEDLGDCYKAIEAKLKEKNGG